MTELSFNEINDVNGGGLTVVEALCYAGSLFIAGPTWPAAVAAIVIIEYQDYKDGK